MGFSLQARHFLQIQNGKGRDSNSIWKSSEISLRSALECINLGELLLLLLTEVYLEIQLVLTSFVSPDHKSLGTYGEVKESTKAPAKGVVIRETPKMPLSKKKEKMTIEKRKGIDLLSEVALTEEAQYEEARKKSLRDFHKTHPSGSCTVTKTTPSAAKIKPFVTNEGTGVKPGVPDVN
ncbi:hypothetical protein Tco_0425665 [Tanacetum coccineum]